MHIIDGIDTIRIQKTVQGKQRFLMTIGNTVTIGNHYHIAFVPVVTMGLRRNNVIVIVDAHGLHKRSGQLTNRPVQHHISINSLKMMRDFFV